MVYLVPKHHKKERKEWEIHSLRHLSLLADLHIPRDLWLNRLQVTWKSARLSAAGGQGPCLTYWSTPSTQQAPSEILPEGMDGDEWVNKQRVMEPRLSEQSCGKTLWGHKWVMQQVNQRPRNERGSEPCRCGLHSGPKIVVSQPRTSGNFLKLSEPVSFSDKHSYQD